MSSTRAGYPSWFLATLASKKLVRGDTVDVIGTSTVTLVDGRLTARPTPFAEVKLLQQLDALNGGAAVCRRIARLREAELVAELRPPLQPGRGPGLLSPTHLGIATLAVLRQLDARDLARRYRARGTDILGHLPGLPLLRACHRLLGALAVAGPEGLLGPIWRDAWSTERRYWLPPSSATATNAQE